MSDGVGTPSDALTAVLSAAENAVQHPPAEPVPDARVTAAFSLGWHVAELYRPDVQTRAPARPDDLPALGRLDPEERVSISLRQVGAGLARVGPAITAAGLKVPDTKALDAAFAVPPDQAARSQAVVTLHVTLLATLTATEARLGRAYGLGRALADTTRHQSSMPELARELDPQRIAQVRSWLDDLASVLPAHAAKSVSQSLGRWADALHAPPQPTPPGTHPGAVPVGPGSELLDLVGRQGELWRALLSGEKAGADMLVVDNYLDAATGMLSTSRRMVARFLIHFWWLAALIVLLFAGGVLLIVLAAGSAASVVAGVGGVLASLGLTWKGVGNTLGGAAGAIEEHLWGAELDDAIADAITLLPTNPKEKGDRRRLAEAARRGATPAGGPAPQLLEPVIDPERLQDKLAQLSAARERRRDDLDALDAAHRLPDSWFDDLNAQIEQEKQIPDRVVRAAASSTEISVPAPPPVIYLSRQPAVSQFMSVITTCIESELNGAVTDIGHLDRLWQGVRHWTDELRGRFRRYGPCDIRFIEPKLAQVVSAHLDGKHAFNSAPPEVHMGDRATVIVLGDWATGLPQALNTAARIREHLSRIEPGRDCHVIHLGDTYYSGLEDECRRRFLDLWPVSRGSVFARSWTLSGNHDVYSGAHGYFDVLLSDPRFSAQAGCSYFALVNEHWQILGLDSAYTNPDRADLHPPQPDWLSGRVAEAAGTRGTILMTHHQPFSAFEAVDAPLAETVARALGDHRVEAWLWGHEHRCAVYDTDIVAGDYRDAAGYTAVIGHGGVPQLMPAQTPDDVERALRWQLADYYQVQDDRWGLGGFAVLSFDGPRVEVQYYDEYGKAARTGPPLAYQPATDVTNRMPDDSRPVRDPDVITPFHQP
jgi:hypothetical protein